MLFLWKSWKYFARLSQSRIFPKRQIGIKKHLHKTYVLSHIRLNRNMETKNHNQLKTKKTICQQPAHGQQEQNFSFKHKVYSQMCWVIMLVIYIARKMKNKIAWQKNTSRITSYLTVDPKLIFLAIPSYSQISIEATKCFIYILMWDTKSTKFRRWSHTMVKFGMTTRP